MLQVATSLAVMASAVMAFSIPNPLNAIPVPNVYNVSGPISSNVTVAVGQANINGWSTPDGLTNQFLGIPFAQPPVGPLRFKAALPLAAPLSGEVDATAFGNFCMMSIVPDTLAFKVTSFLGFGAEYRSHMSEDCLNLNVYSSTKVTKNSNAPVFVYIFGGAYTSGSSSDVKLNGPAMVARSPDVIFVTLNYRNNAFGFLAGQQVLDEGNPLNPGLLDQVVALQWIKDNIASFGGNPDAITVVGHSAGAISIGQHLIANGGNQTLFSRAIMMGGNVNLAPFTVKDTQSVFNGLASKVGCPLDAHVLNCMRDVDAEVLLNASVPFSWGQTADGIYVPFDTLSTVAAGSFSKIPIMVTDVPDEGSLFSLGAGFSRAKTMNASASLSPIFANNSAALNALYPFKDYPYFEPFRQYGDIFGDIAFQCPRILMANAYTAAGVDVYSGIFDHYDEANDFGRLSEFFFGVFHTSEVPFLWLDSGYLHEDEVDFAHEWHDDLINFTRGLTPKGDQWPKYGAAPGNSYSALQAKLLDDSKRVEKCQFIFESVRNYQAKGLIL